MAVHAMTGLNVIYIEDTLPITIGLQYHQEWWRQHNAQRQMFGVMGKIPEIFVVKTFEVPLMERELIV